MKPINEVVKTKPWLGWILFLGTMALVFFIGLFASSIMERRAEVVFAYKPTVKLMDGEPRNEIWGKNYPREFNSYYKTQDTTFKSLYNSGNKTDMLAQDPKLVILWAGYAFSKEYNQPRGHWWAVEDIRNILRTGAPKDEHEGPQPGTCWTCKSPDVPRMMKKMGIESFYKTKWGALGFEIVNPIGCADCHDPETMNLVITRPALIEAFQRQGKDITKASHHEMRSLVCVQCHVEYYFRGDGKYLTFPWDKGYNIEDIEKYYDEAGFKDWEHPISKAPMLKAQHPEYELFRMGIHFDRGIACADCHMPYMNEGGVKYTNHHIRSPLANISGSCQVCHRQSEEKLKENMYSGQKKCFELREKAEQLIVAAHFEAKAAWDAGAKEDEMKPVLTLIRHAQWRWDFTAAGHGNSFHAPLEVARLLGTAIEKASDARVQLARILANHNVTKPIEIPDISTKEKAQKCIGLDMEKLNSEKKEWLKTVVPKWLENAKLRESKYKI
ncbi:MAG: ammonia-forming cytochrome c nitrite reductase [Bacteroidia bacterium]|nr:ammonia-forming cytochrome c nitrite reductase [Bacteroidia bacterium]